MKIIVIAANIGCLVTSALALNLKKNDNLKIVVSGGQDYMGDLLLIDSNSITILDLKERRFAANEIESLYMEKEQIWARLRGSIIGFSAGCLAGLAYELATRGRYTYGINWWGSSNWNKDNPDWRVIPAAGFTGGGIGSFIGSLFNGYREIPLDELFESNLKLASKYNLQVERFQLTASVIF